MRVLLRKTGNGCYYQDPGQWVSNPEKGFDFGSIHQALEYSGKISLDEMELALAFDSSSLISAISLKAAQAELCRKRV
jgi:hypothetical protein